MDVQKHIAGVDEAGRGALAGPVCAAAVVLNPSVPILGIDDSKKLSPQKRHALAIQIKDQALAWSVALVEHDVIDEVNILQATYEAMHKAINELVGSFDDVVELLQIDGNRFRPHTIAHECIVGGDGLMASIGAASILAKDHRDKIMQVDYHREFPLYCFDRHKGYGTALHRSMILKHGPCRIHRTTFLTKILA